MASAKVIELNPPRPGKKAVVLDIDYTIFDLNSAAERPEARCLALCCRLEFSCWQTLISTESARSQSNALYVAKHKAAWLSARCQHSAFEGPSDGE